MGQGASKFNNWKKNKEKKRAKCAHKFRVFNLSVVEMNK